MIPFGLPRPLLERCVGSLRRGRSGGSAGFFGRRPGATSFRSRRTPSWLRRVHVHALARLPAESAARPAGEPSFDARWAAASAWRRAARHDEVPLRHSSSVTNNRAGAPVRGLEPTHPDLAQRRLDRDTPARFHGPGRSGVRQRPASFLRSGGAEAIVRAGPDAADRGDRAHRADQPRLTGLGP